MERAHGQVAPSGVGIAVKHSSLLLDEVLLEYEGSVGLGLLWSRIKRRSSHGHRESEGALGNPA